MQVVGYLLHNAILLRCAAVWEFPAFRRLLVPPCSGSSSIILWHSITLLNTWICSNTTVRTAVWSCFASKFQQYAVFQTYIQNSHTCWIFDPLWPPSHLVIFLEDCAAGQCVPVKLAKYSIKIFAVIDVIYRACAVVQSQQPEGQESCSKCLNGFVLAMQILSTLFAWKRGGAHLAWNMHKEDQTEQRGVAAVWWDGSLLVDRKCRYMKVFYGNCWLSYRIKALLLAFSDK